MNQDRVKNPYSQATFIKLYSEENRASNDINTQNALVGSGHANHARAVNPAQSQDLPYVVDKISLDRPTTAILVTDAIQGKTLQALLQDCNDPKEAEAALKKVIDHLSKLKQYAHQQIQNGQLQASRRDYQRCLRDYFFQDRANLSERELAFLDATKQISETLASYSKQHLSWVHGDLQPRNIMCEEKTGRIIFIDFEKSALGIDTEDIIKLRDYATRFDSPEREVSKAITDHYLAQRFGDASEEMHRMLDFTALHTMVMRVGYFAKRGMEKQKEDALQIFESIAPRCLNDDQTRGIGTYLR